MITNMKEYFEIYRNKLNEALNTIDNDWLEMVKNQILWSAENENPILVCGNGGSASLSEHFSCDHTKGVSMDCQELFPNVISLSSNIALISAIANDISYDEIFSKQIEWFHKGLDTTLVVISASGNSPNIIKALEAAKIRRMTTIAFVGFDGGEIVKNDLAQFVIHVKSDNYGIVEDCHQIIMHSIAQNIRYDNTHKRISELKL